jgi:hypothetical protein
MTPLLAFSPLLDETDFTAESHHEFVVSVLTNVFQKSLDNVLCLIGDNCATNKALADLCGKPLIGCHAHRFNLECSAYLERQETLLAKVCFFAPLVDFILLLLTVVFIYLFIY